jgi:Chitobiase/beta-hexosaminidase C-terminal domain
VGRLNVACYAASGDGEYHGRYPNGDAPLPAQFVSAAAAAPAAVGALTTGIRLFAAPAAISAVSASLTTSPTLPASGGNYVPVFSYTNGTFAAAFSSGKLNAGNSQGGVVNGALCAAIPPSGGHAASGVWDTSIHPIQAGFTKQVTFNYANQNGSAASPGGNICAFTLVIQNYTTDTDPYTYLFGAQSHAPDSLYADANLGGYGGYNLSGQYPIRNSIAIKIDQSPSNQQSFAFNVNTGAVGGAGLYANGGPVDALLPGDDMVSAGINLYNGHTFRAIATYDGTNKALTLVVTDLSTNATFRKTWPIDIPAVIGGNNAFVGICAGVGPGSATQQLIQSWSFGTGILVRLATPTFSVAPGLYGSTQTVAINGPSGASIYYTTNGVEPSDNSTPYTGPVTIAANTVLKAIAMQSGACTDSFVQVGNYRIGASAPIINFPTGFTGTVPISCNGAAGFSAGAIQLVPSGYNSPGGAGSAFFTAVAPANSFTSRFQLKFPAGAAGGGAAGCMWVVQNQNTLNSSADSQWSSGGPNSVANCGSGFGYSGSTGGQNSFIQNSVAVAFDQMNNKVALYEDGQQIGSAIGIGNGVSLNGANGVNVVIGYNGTTLTATLTDPVSGATWSTSFTVDIPTEIGASAGYFGFTGGTAYFNSNQLVTNWVHL